MSEPRIFGILKGTGLDWEIDENPNISNSVVTVKTSETLTDDIKKEIEESIAMGHRANPSFKLIFQVGGF